MSMCPSKFYGILEVRKPYLAIASGENEPVLLSKQFGCGLWAEPGNVDDIREKIEWSIKNCEKLLEMGKLATKIALERYDQDRVAQEWTDLIL